MENSTAKKFALTALVMFLCGVKATESCSCMYEHPQEMLCRSQTYAMLVKVRSMEYVYMAERPKYIPTEDLDEKNKDLDEKDDDKKLEDSKKDDVMKPKKQEMEQVEVVVKDLKRLSQKHFRASYIRYRVKIYEAFKGIKSEDVRERKMYIYTAPDDGMCGIQLDPKKMYLLMGWNGGERLHIGLCDYKLSWSSLDSKRRRVIRRNMRAAKETCAQSCKVHTCLWMGCPMPDADSCIWDSDMEKINRKLAIDPAYYACTREPGIQDAKCVWNNKALSSSRKYRRHRRHHQSLPILEEESKMLP